jgi:hypothetical protein
MVLRCSYVHSESYPLGGERDAYRSQSVHAVRGDAPLTTVLTPAYALPFSDMLPPAMQGSPYSFHMFQNPWKANVAAYTTYEIPYAVSRRVDGGGW